jgi:hypothetical protein
MRRAAILLGTCAAVVVPVALVLGLWRGSHHWLSAVVALALTATPAVITLLIADRLAKGSPFARIAALVLGPIVRLVVGFGGAVAVFYGAGDTFRAEPVVFWSWILGTYLLTLIVETVLLGRQVGNQGSGVGSQDREDGSGRGTGTHAGTADS